MSKRNISKNPRQGGFSLDWAQRCHTQRFCTKCKASGGIPHMDGCDGEFVSIPKLAQLPKRTASKKVWALFIRKFVDKEFIREFYDKQNESRKKIWVDTRRKRVK